MMEKKTISAISFNWQAVLLLFKNASSFWYALRVQRPTRRYRLSLLLPSSGRDAILMPDYHRHFVRSPKNTPAPIYTPPWPLWREALNETWLDQGQTHLQFWYALRFQWPTVIIIRPRTSNGRCRMLDVGESWLECWNAGCSMQPDNSFARSSLHLNH